MLPIRFLDHQAPEDGLTASSPRLQPWESDATFRATEAARRKAHDFGDSLEKLFISHCWRDLSTQKKKRRIIDHLSKGSPEVCCADRCILPANNDRFRYYEYWYKCLHVANEEGGVDLWLVQWLCLLLNSFKCFGGCLEIQPQVCSDCLSMRVRVRVTACDC